MAGKKDPGPSQYWQNIALTIVAIIIPVGVAYDIYNRQKADAVSDRSTMAASQRQKDEPSSSAGPSPSAEFSGPTPVSTPTQVVSVQSTPIPTSVTATSREVSAPCTPELEEMPEVEAVPVVSVAQARNLPLGSVCDTGELGQPLVLTVRLCGGRAATYPGIGFKVTDRNANGRRTNHNVGARIEWAGADGNFRAPVPGHAYDVFSIPTGSTRMRATIEGGDQYGALSMRVCRIIYG